MVRDVGVASKFCTGRSEIGCSACCHSRTRQKQNVQTARRRMGNKTIYVADFMCYKPCPGHKRCMAKRLSWAMLGLCLQPHCDGERNRILPLFGLLPIHGERCGWLAICMS